MRTTSPLKHFAAFIYDLFPVVGLFILTSLIVLIIRKGEIVDQHTLWFDLLIFTEMTFYFVYSWKVGGQTLGMRAWKMKIVSAEGQLTWVQAFIRYFVGIVSTLLLGLGLFWKLFSKDNSSWMDILSRSKTITIEKQ